MKTHNFLLIGFGLFFISLLSACSQINISRVLLLDVDKFQSNTNMAISLPGLPDGDRAENIANAEPILIDQLTGKSLRVSSQIDLIPLIHDKPEKYLIAWEGFRSHLGNTADTIISFLDQNNKAVLRIIFRGRTGILELETGDITPNSNHSSVKHKFSITMTPETNKFDYKFEQKNCEGDSDCNNWKNLKYLDSDFTTIKRIRIEGGEYFINDLTVYVTPSL